MELVLQQQWIVTLPKDRAIEPNVSNTGSEETKKEIFDNNAMLDMKREVCKEGTFCSGTDLVTGTSSTATINSYATKDKEIR